MPRDREQDEIEQGGRARGLRLPHWERRVRPRVARRRRERHRALAGVVSWSVPLAVVIAYIVFSITDPARTSTATQHWREQSLRWFSEPSGLAVGDLREIEGPFRLVGVDDEKEGIFVLTTYPRVHCRDAGCVWHRLFPWRDSTRTYVKSYIPLSGGDRVVRVKDLEGITYDPAAGLYYVLPSYRRYDQEDTHQLLRVRLVDDDSVELAGKIDLRSADLLQALNAVLAAHRAPAIDTAAWKLKRDPYAVELEGIAVGPANKLFIGVRRPLAGWKAILLTLDLDTRALSGQALPLGDPGRGQGISELAYDSAAGRLYVVANPDSAARPATVKPPAAGRCPELRSSDPSGGTSSLVAFDVADLAAPDPQRIGRVNLGLWNVEGLAILRFAAVGGEERVEFVIGTDDPSCLTSRPLDAIFATHPR